MTPYHYVNGTLSCDNTKLSSIAETYGTPCYIYSETQIIKRVTQLRDALNASWTSTNKPFIAFAMKANSNRSILQIMNNLGCGADIVSGGELQRARAAGIKADHIIFSGVGKTDDEITLALNESIRQINVESSAELYRIDALSRAKEKPIQVALRYTPDVVSGAHEKMSTGEEDNKFGLTESEIIALYNEFRGHPFIQLHGLSMHIGSGVPSLTPFEDAFKKLATLVATLRANGHTVTELDLGGGLWVPYNNEPEPPVEDYAALINQIFAPLNVNIALEPGRLLIAESGALLTRVIYTKERDHKQFVIVDAAMNDLIRPTLYESYHPILPVEENKTDAKAPRDVVGPVCESGDFFAENRDLTPLTRGDLLAITVAGAYGSVMSSLYNTRPMAAEVLITSHGVKLIRSPQRVDDIWRDEV